MQAAIGFDSRCEANYNAVRAKKPSDHKGLDDGPRGKLMQGYIPRKAKETTEVVARRMAERDTRSIICLGYVDLPFARRGGVPRGGGIDCTKVDQVDAGTSYVQPIASADITTRRESDGSFGTCDFSRLADVGVIIGGVPTPFTHPGDLAPAFAEGTAPATLWSFVRTAIPSIMAG